MKKRKVHFVLGFEPQKFRSGSSNAITGESRIYLSAINIDPSPFYDLLGNIVYVIAHEQLHLDITNLSGTYWDSLDYDRICEDFQGRWFVEKAD